MAAQIERLERLRAERDGRRAAEALKAIVETARGEGNLIPRILEAVESLATLGEISDAMREVFGEYHDRG